MDRQLQEKVECNGAGFSTEKKKAKVYAHSTGYHQYCNEMYGKFWITLFFNTLFPDIFILPRQGLAIAATTEALASEKVISENSSCSMIPSLASLSYSSSTLTLIDNGTGRGLKYWGVTFSSITNLASTSFSFPRPDEKRSGNMVAKSSLSTL